MTSSKQTRHETAVKEALHLLSPEVQTLWDQACTIGEPVGLLGPWVLTVQAYANELAWRHVIMTAYPGATYRENLRFVGTVQGHAGHNGVREVDALRVSFRFTCSTFETIHYPIFSSFADVRVMRSTWKKERARILNEYTGDLRRRGWVCL